MKLEFYNCPSPADITQFKLPETPGFVKYAPDFEVMKKQAEKYQQFENLLIVGHGGSLNTVAGFCEPYKNQLTKKVFYLSTIDPDYVFELKQKLKKENTLVIAISKSGENTTQIEALSQFMDFPLLIITGSSSPLRAMAEKLKADIVLHPSIGGRYASFTEVGLLPAMIAGLDAEGLYKGAKTFYYLYEKDNLAWRAASTLNILEQKGYVDVFMPFYTHNLFQISSLIVQLCHESFGKAGLGQTYFAHEAPESQHHTNQRFFGGRKNICGFFMTAESFAHQVASSYPPALHSVQIKGHHLADINKIPLDIALDYEAGATMEDARINSIPVAHLSINNFSFGEVGAFTAFWQLFAVYSSVLRNVDPFDQPQVENSKKISFNKRLQYKGLL